MRYYIDPKNKEVYGFENDGMIEFTPSQFDAYKNKPSKYHDFNIEKMEWVISKEGQKKLKLELEELNKAEAIESMAIERAIATEKLKSLQHRVDLGRADSEHFREIDLLKAYIIDIDDWTYPQKMPVEPIPNSV